LGEKREEIMLQIIGWMGCVYLLVKCFEFWGSNAYRKADGSFSGVAAAGSVVAMLGAIVFFLMVNAQASSSSESLSSLPSAYP
jgi:hypothetical protein